MGGKGSGRHRLTCECPICQKKRGVVPLMERKEPVVPEKKEAIVNGCN